MVLAGWGLNPAGFCCFATMLHRAPCGRSGHFHGAPCQTCGMSWWGFFACGCIIFRASESNVREFLGGWFWQVWVWILLRFWSFATNAPQSTFQTKWPLPRSPFPNLWHVLLGFVCLWLHHLSLQRQKATLESFEGMVLAGLGLNSAWVLLFRNHAPRSTFQTTWPLPHSPFPNLWHVLLGFVCLWLHHLSLGRQKATLVTFTRDGSGRFGHESCWGSAVSQPCSTEPLADEVATSTEPLAKPVACLGGVSLLAVASSFGRQKQKR